MRPPRLSPHCEARQPSSIRLASIEFAARTDGVRALNVAIGNVSLPMHPAMAQRLREAGQPGKPFADGVVRYTSTVGEDETRRAFLHVLEASGLSTQGLHCQITDGGSQAMELAILAACGPAGSAERPLLLIDAAYTNYTAFAARLGRRTVSIQRSLGEDGRFALPPLDEIERVIRAERPSALVVIPYDNPTGQLYDVATLRALAELCCQHGMWLFSDEAYRELHYTGTPAVSIWALPAEQIEGLHGRRASIETTSKVWNACGLRIGAMITDNAELHRQCVAENTASLCSNALGQHIFGAIAQEPLSDLRAWFGRQRDYYGGMLREFVETTRALLPGAIVSRPDAAIYSVVDLRQIVDASFDTDGFVRFCASHGNVDGWTLLTAPMGGFYHVAEGKPNPGRTQLRVAYVLPPQEMRRVPALLQALLAQYLSQR
jgi:aspartate aminotransferase